MTPEFVYQKHYECTVDTLALRENLKKILANAGVNSVSSQESAASLIVEKSTKLLNAELLDEIDNYSSLDVTQQCALNNKLKSTLDFLNSEVALKLLRLTNKDRKLENEYVADDSLAEILTFKVDESKKNIFAA